MYSISHDNLVAENQSFPKILVISTNRPLLYPFVWLKTNDWLVVYQPL
jgi:hypothetical protein